MNLHESGDEADAIVGRPDGIAVTPITALAP